MPVGATRVDGQCTGELVIQGANLAYEDIISDEGLLLIAAWTRDGHTQQEIHQHLGISQQTWYNWRKKSKKQKGDPLGNALRKGKDVVDFQVENALLKAALGYQTKTVKTIIGPIDENGNRKVKTETTVSEVGPNTTACLAWLNNRKPDAWRRNRDNTFEYEDKQSGITINIVKGNGNSSQVQADADADDSWDDSDS